jgi:hypothetical protein
MANIDRNLEARARRAAARVGLRVSKSRDRTEHVNNRGGFMLFNPLHNWVVMGERFDLSAEDVIEACANAKPAVPYGRGSDVLVFAGWRAA